MTIVERGNGWRRWKLGEIGFEEADKLESIRGMGSALNKELPISKSLANVRSV